MPRLLPSTALLNVKYLQRSFGPVSSVHRIFPYFRLSAISHTPYPYLYISLISSNAKHDIRNFSSDLLVDNKQTPLIFSEYICQSLSVILELLYVRPIGCYPIFSSPFPISRIISHNIISLLRLLPVS